jgi:hypothetical protein
MGSNREGRGRCQTTENVGLREAQKIHRNKLRRSRKKIEKAGICRAGSNTSPFESRHAHAHNTPRHHARHFVPQRRPGTALCSPCGRRTRWRRSRGKEGSRFRLPRGHHRHQRRRSRTILLGRGAPAFHQTEFHPRVRDPLARGSPSQRFSGRYSPHSRPPLPAGTTLGSEAKSGRSARQTLLTWDLKSKKGRLATRSEEQEE